MRTQKPHRLIFGALVFVLCALGTSVFVVFSSYRQATSDVCSLVENNYFKSDDETVQTWLRSCYERAVNQPAIVSREKTIGEINTLLSELGVSHLFLYTPEENRAIWQNESLDTGLRAWNIDGELYISEVLPRSVAAQSKIRVGDHLVLINDQPVGQPSQVVTASGFFTFERAGKKISVNLIPQTLAIDLEPTVSWPSRSVAVVRIQSFLSQYFEESDWRKKALQLKSAKKVILDLRGNAGGSFPAMLRVASSFNCGGEILGSLYRNESARGLPTASLVNDLNAHNQLDQVMSSSELALKSFIGYECSSVPVTVLIDSATSSVSEILAESFLRRPESRVWGMPSAGEVVMARWFPVAALGAGDYSISIPIAGYRSKSGAEIEAEGVLPQKLLSYKKSDAERGLDSWIKDAVSN